MAMPMDRLIRCLICLVLLLPSARLLADELPGAAKVWMQVAGRLVPVKGVRVPSVLALLATELAREK